MKKHNLIITILLVLCISIILLILILLKKSKSLKVQLPFNIFKSPSHEKILCFTGGGFTAICAHTGMIKGIRYRKGDLRNILKDCSIMGGNSGGSWFVSLLTYSKKYFDMLDSSDKNYSNEEYRKYITQACESMENAQNNIKWKKYIEKLPSFLNDIKKILYLSSKNWQEVVKEIVFDPIGDIDNRTISENPNKLWYSVVWSTAVSRYSLLNDTHAYSLSHPSCKTNINEKNNFLSSSEIQTDLQNCGIAFPATFNWNLGESKSDVNFYSGNDPIPDIKCGEYDRKSNLKNIKTFSINEKLTKPISEELKVTNIASCSGAAGAILSNLKSLDEILASYNLEFLFSFIAEELSNSYKNKAIPIDLSGNNMKFTPNGGIENKDICPGVFIRLFDGGYCDNTSIASSIKTWQSKHNDMETCHIINFNDISNDKEFDTTMGYKKTNKDIINLFGTDSDKVVKRFSGVYTEKPVIFPEEDFSKGKCLWWGKHTSNAISCIEDEECYAELSVNYYPTKTVENKSFGIKAGTKVNLFVIQTNTKKAPIFILPDTISDKTLINNYVKTAEAVTKLVENIDKDVLNAVMDPTIPVPTRDCGKHAINIS